MRKFSTILSDLQTECKTLRDRLNPDEAITAFKGLMGAVIRILPAKQRVQILLDFMGRATEVELHLGQLLFRRQEAAGLVLSEDARSASQGRIRARNAARASAIFPPGALKTGFQRPADLHR